MIGRNRRYSQLSASESRLRPRASVRAKLVSPASANEAEDAPEGALSVCSGVVSHLVTPGSSLCLPVHVAVSCDARTAYLLHSKMRIGVTRRSGSVFAPSPGRAPEPVSCLQRVWPDRLTKAIIAPMDATKFGGVLMARASPIAVTGPTIATVTTISTMVVVVYILTMHPRRRDRAIALLLPLNLDPHTRLEIRQAT